MLYSRYVQKITRVANFFKKLYAHKVPIIIATAAVIVTSGSLVAAKGLIVADSDCPTEVIYGDALGYSANAFLAKVTYEYNDGSAWTTTAPTEVGTYRVRAVGKAAFGGVRYSDEHTFRIMPRPIKVRVDDDSVMYGEVPPIAARMAYGDTVSGTVVLADPYAPNTTAYVDPATITLQNKKGEDVSRNYTVEETPASAITITPRPLEITVEDQDKIYDGVALTFDGYTITSGTLVAGDTHLATYTMPTELTDVGLVLIEPDIVVLNAEGKDITACYDVLIITGTLEVEPRPLLIQVADASFVYNGEKQTSTDYTLSASTPLVPGHRLEIMGSSFYRDVGTYKNYLELYVLDADGNHQTDNHTSVNGHMDGPDIITDGPRTPDPVVYNYFVETGELTITHRPITVTTPTSSWVYDGEKHNYLELVEVDNMAPTDHMAFGSWTSVRDVTEEPVENTVKILFFNGDVSAKDEVTDNYKITNVNNGTLEITPRPVTVTTASERWMYDGYFHDFDESTTTIGGLGPAYEESWRLEDTLSVIDVTPGTPNTATVHFSRIENGRMVDTTSNYDITYDPGTIIVDPRPITIETPSESWVYDGFEHLLMGTDDLVIGGEGLAEPDELARLDPYTAVRNATAGTPNEVTVTIWSTLRYNVSVNENYSITYTYGTIVVTPRPVTVLASGYDAMYDSMEHYPDVTVLGDGVAPGDRVEIVDQPILQDVIGVDEPMTNDATVRFHPIDPSVVVDEATMEANYEITYERESIRITPRPVVITADFGVFEYDGTDHSVYNTLRVDDLAPLDSLEFVAGTELQPLVDVTLEPVYNTVVWRITRNGKDVRYNYTVTEQFGTVTITPRPIEVVRYGLETTYDGTPKSNSAFDIYYAGTMEAGLVYRDEAIVDPATVATATNVWDTGTVNDLRILIRKIGTNEDASGNYDITYNDAPTLTILPRIVIVTVESRYKIYDAQPLTCPDYWVINLVAGHELFIEVSGTITDAKNHDVNSVANVGLEETLTIVDADGNNVKENYTPSILNGTLYVYPRPVIVTSQDATFLYDGQGHASPGYTWGWNDDFFVNFILPKPAGDAVLPTHTLKVDMTTEAINVGPVNPDGTYPSVTNSMTVTLTDAMGADVSGNYSITKNEGQLTILPRPIGLYSAHKDVLYDAKEHTLPLDTAQIEWCIPQGGQWAGILPDGEALLSEHTLSANFAAYMNRGTYSFTVGDPTSLYIYDNRVGTESNVTSNYLITFLDETGAPADNAGTLTIHRRPIIITTESDSKVYDGTPLTNPNYSIAWDQSAASQMPAMSNGAAWMTDPICAEHSFFGSTNGTVTYVEVEPVFNTLSYSILDDQAVSVAFNYDIAIVKGELRIQPLAQFVIIPASSESIAYADSADYTASSESIAYADSADYTATAYELPADHTVTASYFVVPGTYTGQQIPMKVTHTTTGRDVTNCFSLNVVGSVTVRARYLHLDLKEVQLVYNGNEQRSTDYVELLDSEGLPAGHMLSLGTTARVTDVDLMGIPTPNEVDRDKTRIDRNGNDVTACFDIVVESGSVLITRRPFTVTTGSAQKTYDGKPLIKDEFTLSGSGSYQLLSREDFDYRVTLVNDENFIGLPTMTVVRENSIASVSVYDRYTGKDVTGNFSLIEQLGTLTISKITAGITSTQSGTFYLRESVYGVYNGTNTWGSVPAIEPTLDGVYSVDYLPGEILRALEGFFSSSGLAVNQGTMTFTMWDESGVSTLFPYYMLMTADDPVKVGDTLTDSNYTATFTTPPDNWMSTFFFLRDNYGKAMLLPDNYETAEEEVYQFARTYYLGASDTLDADTQLALQAFIEDNGLNAYTDDLSRLTAVQEAVQAFGVYDPKADTLHNDNMVYIFLRNGRGVCRHYAMLATLVYRQLGMPARYVTGFRMDDMKAGQLTALPKEGHAWVEIYVEGLGWIMQEVTGSRTGEEEETTPTPTPPTPLPPTKPTISLQPTYTEYVYDGITYGPAQSLQAIDMDSGMLWLSLQSEGYQYEVTVSGERQNVGSTETEVTRFKLYDAQMNLVYWYEDGTVHMEHDTYIFDFQLGSLRITSDTKLQVYLCRDDKVYDGSPLDLSNNPYHVFSQAGQTYTLEDFSLIHTMTDIGAVTLGDLNRAPNTYATYVIRDASGNDVTDCVDIEFVNYKQEAPDDYVVFEVKRITIILKAKDVTAVYSNGAVLKPAGCELVYGELLAEFGHYIDYDHIVISGECTAEGETAAAVIDPSTIQIYDSQHNLVNDYYDISCQEGSLYFDKDAA